MKKKMKPVTKTTPTTAKLGGKTVKFMVVFTKVSKFLKLIPLLDPQ